MNLIIDEGNTSVKIAVFDNGIRQWNAGVPFSETESYLRKLEVLYDFDACIVSTVVGEPERFAFLRDLVGEVHFLSASTPVPFENAYDTPQTLGVDRIALIAGAVSRFPSENVLVIDAGTCITFDIVDERGTYWGGAISPGIQMRFRAMHEFTSKLPMITEQNFNINNFIGTTTEECLLSGVYHNIICEIEGVIARYKEEFKILTVVLTGGDHLYLAENVKSRIFANPFFLLDGLDAILAFQNGKK